MNIKNVNKPTAAKWGKIQVACASAATFISGYGHFDNNSWIFIVGIAIGVIGTIIPVLADE